MSDFHPLFLRILVAKLVSSWTLEKTPPQLSPSPTSSFVTSFVPSRQPMSLLKLLLQDFMLLRSLNHFKLGEPWLHALLSPLIIMSMIVFFQQWNFMNFLLPYNYQRLPRNSILDPGIGTPCILIVKIAPLDMAKLVPYIVRILRNNSLLLSCTLWNKIVSFPLSFRHINDISIVLPSRFYGSFRHFYCVRPSHFEIQQKFKWNFKKEIELNPKIRRPEG